MLLLLTAPKTEGCVSEHGRSIPLADETVVQVSFCLMPDKGTLNNQECTDNQGS